MTCRTCKHVDLKPDSDSARQMRKLGFARCFLRNKWQYQAATYTCPKWSEKK